MPANPSPSNPAGDNRNLVAVDENALTFGDKLQAFWERNGKAVIIVCAAIILGVMARGLWQYFANQREIGIEKDYAAATTPEQLKAFAASHSGHTLAAIAQLRMADDAYTAGKFADAATGYDQVLGVLKTGPLAARAQLGRGIARIQSGKTAEGTADLKQIFEDENQLKAMRAEAGYHLASLAAETHNSDEVQKISDRLIQIDPSSLWSQRALSLRARMPVPAASSMPAAATPATKPAEASPGVKLNLPTK
jgi:hypothetical protein